MARLSIPTTAKLPSSLRVESSNPFLLKSLSRLSREALISLAISWLDDANVANAVPLLRRRRRRPTRRDDKDRGEGGSKEQQQKEAEEAEEDQEDQEDQEEEDDLFPPCSSIEELQHLYIDLQQRKGSKRDVISRILEGDWRHGLTLYQIAMVDFTYFDEHPISHKWTAYRILPLELPRSTEEDRQVLPVDRKALNIPRFHPSTFLQNLQRQALPDVKAHYQFYRPRNLSILLLRIFVVETPYNTSISLSSQDAGGGGGGNSNSSRRTVDPKFSASRVIYLAFPDGAPSLFITKFQTTGALVHGESRNLFSLIVGGVPNALSRPRERYTLKNTNLSSKNLGALLDKRGAGRANAAGGGWSIYADEKTKQSPLDTVISNSSSLSTQKWALSGTDKNKRRHVLGTTEEQQVAKRAKIVGKARFGSSGIVTDGKGVEKLEVLLEDAFPGPHIPPQDQPLEQPHDHPIHRRESPDQELEQARSRSARGARDALTRQAAGGDEEDQDSARDATESRPSVRLKFQGPHIFAGIRQLLEAGIINGDRMPGWMTGEDGVTTGVVRHGRLKGSRVP